MLVKIYLKLRIAMVQAQLHDLEIAWAHCQRTALDYCSVVKYQHAVWQRTQQLQTRLQRFQKRLHALK